MKTFKVQKGYYYDVVKAESYNADENRILRLVAAGQTVATFSYWDSIVDTEYDVTQTKE